MLWPIIGFVSVESAGMRKFLCSRYSSCSKGCASSVDEASESEPGNGYVDDATVIRSGDSVTMCELTGYRIVRDAVPGEPSQ